MTSINNLRFAELLFVYRIEKSFRDKMRELGVSLPESHFHFVAKLRYKIYKLKKEIKK